MRLAVRGRRPPRVAALEWLDPVYVAGHWTPQLIELRRRARRARHARRASGAPRSWEEVAASEPDVVVAMPCGYDARRARWRRR